MVRALIALAAGCAGLPGVGVVANHAPDRHVFVAAIEAPEGGMVIAAVGESSVRVVARVAGVDQLGWLDARTVIAMTIGNALLRVDDGRATPINYDAWPHAVSQLELSTTGEIWLGCDADCDDPDYLRVAPAPPVRTDKLPATIDIDRVTGRSTGDDPWPLPASIDAPPGIELTVAALDGMTDEHYGSPLDYDGVVCTSAAGRTSYTPTVDPAGGFAIRSVRWVNATPPIYEVAALHRTAIEEPSILHVYVRACETAALGGFAQLGDGRWAEYAESDDPTWTFYDHVTAIGTLRAIDRLRVSP